jgi:hypothetical protein
LNEDFLNILAKLCQLFSLYKEEGLTSFLYLVFDFFLDGGAVFLEFVLLLQCIETLADVSHEDIFHVGTAVVAIAQDPFVYLEISIAQFL